MKAQSATDFLLTYGWAILIVIVVGAVLVYYGVFKPTPVSSAPDTSDLKCANFLALHMPAVVSMSDCTRFCKDFLYNENYNDAKFYCQDWCDSPEVCTEWVTE